MCYELILKRLTERSLPNSRGIPVGNDYIPTNVRIKNMTLFVPVILCFNWEIEGQSSI